jgi:uncharacterized protein YndB with AHSA1/START domain
MGKDKSWRRLRQLGLAALGFSAGAVFGSGYLVRVYDWETEWNIDAPLAEVYRVMTTPEEQYRWWPSMAVQEVTSLPGMPDGRKIVYRVQQAANVARLAPPFVITAVTADREHERRMRSVVTGDLVGVLETLFYSRPDGGTRIRYHWYVRVHHPVLNMLGYLIEPLYRASHDHVMREGEAGLQRYCAAHIGKPASS